MTMRLSPELFAAYERDGLKLDATVRQMFGIPATSYYVVTQPTTAKSALSPNEPPPLFPQPIPPQEAASADCCR